MGTNVKQIDYVFISCSHRKHIVENETRYDLSNLAILATNSNFGILDVFEVDVHKQLNKDNIEKAYKLLSTCKYIVYWKYSDYELLYGYFCNHFDNAIHVEFREVVNSVVNHEEPILDIVYTYIKVKHATPSLEMNNSKNRNAILYILYTDMYKQYQNLSNSLVFVLDTHNRRIHKDTCIIQKEYAKTGGLIELFRGYKLCESCFNTQDAKLMRIRKSSTRDNTKTEEEIQEDSLRQLQVNPGNIRLIRNYFNIPRVILEGSCITVETKEAFWRVYVNMDDTVDKVYHCPKTKKNKKNRRECRFHTQDINKGTVFDTIRYIYYHDKDAKVTKKTRVQKILEQISNEKEAQ